jgi:signal transduction histidine kinase/ligand-binding sensor domain-containing protein
MVTSLNRFLADSKISAARSNLRVSLHRLSFSLRASRTRWIIRPQRMMSTRWILCWAVAFLAATTTGWTQKASNWRVYKSADGLPESHASSVTVSSRGTVWVKHLNSPLISSLDGYSVKTLPSPGIGANRFYESPGGQVWTIATNGLQLFMDDHWIQYPIPEIAAEFRDNIFNVFRPVPLCPVRQNRVLFLTSDALREFNIESTDRPITSVLLPVNRTHLQKFTSMVATRDGGLWLTAVKGLAKISGPLRSAKGSPEWREFPVSEAQSFQNLRDPVEDDVGGITALADSIDGSGSMLVRFDGTRWSVLAMHLKNVTHAWLGGDGTCWATTGRQLLEIKAGQTVTRVDEQISVQRIFDFAVEQNGVFWLATSDGLYRYAPLTWRSPAGDGNITSSVEAITEDQQGQLWVAASDAVYASINGQWKSYSYPDGVADIQPPMMLLTLPNGTVAIGLGDRLLQFNPAAQRFEITTHGAESHLKTLGALKDGRLVLQIPGGDGGALRYRLELYDGRDYTTFPYLVPELDLGNDLLFLFAAQNGNLWLCGNKGMACFDPNREKKWQLSSPPGEIVPENASCITDVGESHIWCGIQDRIWEYDGKSWHSIQAGFDHVNAMFKARDGSVWAASANGLHRFYQRTWAINNTDEGLPVSSILAVAQDSKGRLWAGTAHGLSLYHPEADPDSPRTSIHELSDSKASLPEGAFVTLSFSAEDRWKYTPRDELLFSYRINQKDWSPFQDERSAVFSDLPPGKHYFQVRSMDRNWNVDQEPARLEFVIALPWYKESRLLLIGSAGLALAIFFASLAINRHLRLVRSYAEIEAKVALRTKQLELANLELFHSQKMRALGTLAAGIAHDFNNILSIIKGSTQIIEDNLSNPEKITTRTGRIKTVVDQGTGIVNAMLGFSIGSEKNLAASDANTIVENTITLLGDRFRRDVAVEFMPARNLPKVSVSKDFVQQILLNLIFNAAEAMTEHKRIVLATATSRKPPPKLALAPAAASEYVIISVKDFGSGIAPEIMPRIFEPFFTTKAFSARRGTGLGLSMVYELAGKMNAGLAVESIVGKGSTFSLILPVRDLPMDAPGETK